MSSYAESYEHLSREQGHALNARNILRAVPLLLPEEGVEHEKVRDYFTHLLDFVSVLVDVGLGNRILDAAKNSGAKAYEVLGDARALTSESEIVSAGILCVADALGDLQLISYNFAWGASEKAMQMVDVDNMVGHCAFCLQKRGLKEEIMHHPSELDLRYINENRHESLEPFVNAEFFRRELWPCPGPYQSDRGMPHPFELIILNDWLGAMQPWSDISCRYEKLLEGMSVKQKLETEKEQPMTVVNNITVTLNDGSTWKGDINAGKYIQRAADSAGEVKNDDLKVTVEELVSLVTKLIDSTPDKSQQSEIAQQLDSLVEQVETEEPKSWSVRVSAKGLVQAAKTVATLADPVAACVNKVVQLVLGESLED
ncbi:MAG: hypothetical protein JJ956_08695 [Pseudomonadales bacterium]|nr:hypothetical protein [Pseudomonadales bacterium]